MEIKNKYYYESAAEWIHQLVKDKSCSSYCLARLVSITAFPIFCAFDLVCHGGECFVRFVAYTFNPYSTLVEFTNLKREVLIVEKAFRGIVLSVAGLYKPDAISFQFLPQDPKAVGVDRCA